MIRKKTHNILYAWAITIFISGCFGFPTEWDIALWEQRIEGSNLSIYKFDAWGGRDSHISGLKIKNSSKGFTQNDVLYANGFSYLNTIPNKDSVFVIKTVKPNKGESNSNKPISKDRFVIEG